jgi:High potential iron-sulfur protein
MKTRRQFIKIAPVCGLAVLAACSEKAPAPAPVAVVPTPAPAPAPAAAPIPTPAPAPAPAPAASAPAPAAGGLLDEKDAQAVALGYVANAATVDKAKWKQFVEGQHCGTCALFQGTEKSTSGGCGIFAGKQVAETGWCSAYNKKAA